MTDSGNRKTGPATATVTFDGVSKSFRGTRALDDVSFEVREGETVALLGPSGCGKTTTLRLIGGFEQPDTGSIAIAGASVAGLRPYERNVGIVFQNYALFPHMSVEQNIAFGLRHRRFPRHEIAARVSRMLAMVRLSDLGARRPAQLSGGQQQRVALARALATSPEVLLLDEPLSALDTRLRDELRGELKQMLAQARTTTILVTHDQTEATSLSDRIFVMNAGRIEQQGTPDEIYRRSATRFVAEFMGPVNWLRPRLTGGIERDGPLVGARPESLRLHASGTTATSGSVCFEARVDDIEVLGALRNIRLRTEDGEQVLATDTVYGGAPWSVGQSAAVTIDEAHLLTVRR